MVRLKIVKIPIFCIIQSTYRLNAPKIWMCLFSGYDEVNYTVFKKLGRASEILLVYYKLVLMIKSLPLF